MTQPALDFSAKVQHAIDVSREQTIDQRFAEFHAEHPEVYDELRKLALEAKASGRAHGGISMLWEVMRWSFFLRVGETDFKLNNDFRSRYARLLMEREPELVGFFETRKLRVEDEA